MAELKDSGAAIQIAFNSKYLIDAVSHANSDIVKLCLAGQLSPMKIMELVKQLYCTNGKTTFIET